jgi:DNA-directed RNA polymerase specialized sigma24 family protein
MWPMLRAIGTLGRAHREILGLVFTAELTMAEVSEILEIPRPSAQSRARQMRGVHRPSTDWLGALRAVGRFAAI